MEPQEPVLVQGVAFVLAGLTGVVIGLGTDIYRAFLGAFRPPRWLSHALDVALVLCVVPVLAVGLLVANWGALRVYPLAALVLGFGLYLCLGSPLILPALTWPAAMMVGVVRRLWALGWRLAAWPVRRLGPSLVRCVHAVGAFFARWRRGPEIPSTKPPPISGGG